MKPYSHAIIQRAYLGTEILHSSSKCTNWVYKVLFAGAEKIGCQWRINFILTFICLSNSQKCECQSASSANMYVVTEPGKSIRFDNYLGIIKKESMELSPGNYQLCDRFFPAKHIKLLEIETDHLEYEICFI